MTHLGIVELGDMCRRQQSAALELFEILGGWAMSTDGPRQRVFATASHRHAWHAELWADRSPTIPGLDDHAPAPRWPAVAETPSTARGATYAAILAELDRELGVLAERIDADLDPSTARTISLVRADHADLLDRLAGIRR